jgi:type IV pilus assembly protein PilQ
MTKIITRLAAAGVGLLLAFAGFGQVKPAPASVPKITILPTRVYTRLVVEAAAPLADFKASYAPGPTASLVVDLGRIAAPTVPLIPVDEPQLVREVKVQSRPDGGVSLIVGLREPVPFRLWTEGTKAVLELNKIMRGTDYFIAPETQAELDRTARKPVVLPRVEVADRNDRLEVLARFGQKGILNIFALENPLRLVVDVFDAQLAGPTPAQPVDKYGLDRVKVGQFRAGDPYTITRIVLDLKEPRGYALSNTASGLTISLAGTPAAASAQAPAPSPAGIPSPPPNIKPTETKTAPTKPAETKPPEAKPAAPAKTETATPPPAKKAESKPTETKTTPTKPAETKPPETKPAAPAKTELKPPEQIAAPVTAPIKESPPAARPKAEEEKAAPPKAQEPQKEEPAPQDKFKPRTLHDQGQKYAGELISPKFKNADLQDVVLWLGERAGLNVMFDPEVKGTVTCSFESVPWDQFLDYILKNNKMGKVLDGNILRIAPVGVLAEEQRQEQALRDAVEQSGPLVTKTYTLSYAKAQDVLDLMKDQKSARGQMFIDARTNTLVVRDSQEKVDLFDKLISDLDTQTPQVQIETRIIEATSNFVRNLGIQWGTKGIVDPFYGNQTSVTFPNKILVDGAQIPVGDTTRGIGGPLGGYAVNLPASGFNTVFGLSFANILDTFRLDMAISALETQGEGRIVSSQRVTTQNNKEAYLNQGRQIPVQTQANFTVTVQYVNAGLELRATPQITAEGTVIMYVEIKNDAADFANLVNGIPPITTQSAKTTVTVSDGGTTVIGGIFRIEDSITRGRVPFLHQIPLLGLLFKNSSVTKQNRELLIFITPRIMR